jgi:hypothetical protein
MNNADGLARIDGSMRLRREIPVFSTRENSMVILAARNVNISVWALNEGRLGTCAASQALQAGLPSVPEADSIDLAAAAMVTGANCRLAQAHVSGGASKAGVTRDDLSQLVHSGAWRAEKGAA